MQVRRVFLRPALVNPDRLGDGFTKPAGHLDHFQTAHELRTGLSFHVWRCYTWFIGESAYCFQERFKAVLLNQPAVGAFNHFLGIPSARLVRAATYTFPRFKRVMDQEGVRVNQEFLAHFTEPDT